MSRKPNGIRGIVLAAASGAMLLLAACTPPMPPDVLAAKAEAQIVCQTGEVQVGVPETLAGSMVAVGAGLGGVCPEQTVAEVPLEENPPIVLVDRTPTPADIEEFASANCPAGTPIVIPAFGYPVTIAYNVIGLEGVVMTPEIVAGILSGTITSWEDPLIAASNQGFDFTALPEMVVMSVETPQGSVEAMTAWLSEEAPEAWTKGTVGTLEGGQVFPTTADMIAEMTAFESSIAVLPIFQAFNNVLATAEPSGHPGGRVRARHHGGRCPAVQGRLRGHGRHHGRGRQHLRRTRDGGVPVEGNFDIAASKIVLAEGQPLVGWPVIGYAHLLVCDDPKDPLPLSLAQYVVRLAGQGALETLRPDADARAAAHPHVHPAEGDRRPERRRSSRPAARAPLPPSRSPLPRSAIPDGGRDGSRRERATRVG